MSDLQDKSNLHVTATELQKEKKAEVKVMDITEVVDQAVE